MTWKTYCGNLLWQSSLTLLPPPLADQRRIATKLDRLCDVVAKRKQQLVQLQQLVKSRFVEAA
jgi:restriction endonuclease S subunit